MHRVSIRPFLYLTFLLSVLLTGCGSGNNGGGGSPPLTPDFSLSLAPTSLTLTAGSSTTFQVSLQPLNGFTGSASVEISGLPAGVTVQPGTTFSVSASTPQTVTVSCASSVAAGAYSVQATATSGSLSHSGTETVTIQAGAQPDFTLALTPASLTLAAGTSTTFQVSIQAVNGFTGAASVQISGLPTGVTVQPGATFSVSASTPQTVTVISASTAAAGTDSVQVTATSGSLSHSETETLTIQVPVNPDFALTLTPASLSLGSGMQGSFQIAMQPSEGFSGSVQVQISGMPAGATISPSGTFALSSSEPQTVTVATTNSLTAGPYPLTIAASSGSLKHSATETVTVVYFGALPSRADFVRADDTPGDAVYDKAHQLVFETNPIAGTVDVISSVTYQILRRIPVPSPAGIDISPDNSTVFIGTNTQVLYALNTATMAMTARYFAPLNQLTPTLVQAQPPLAPVAAPDGTVLISLSGSIVKWNPATNQTTTVTTNAPVGFQYGLAQGPMARSAGHTKVILSNNLSTSTVYVYDETSDTFSAPLTFNGYAYAVAANPAGTQFAVAWTDNNSVNWITFLDGNLNSTAVISDGGSILYSFDGSVLYVSGIYSGPGLAIGLLDTTTFKVTGMTPLYASSEGNRYPPLMSSTPLTVDETGRVFGSADHGLAIDDTTDIRAYTGTEVEPIYDLSAVPDAGPVDQEQTVEIETSDLPVSEVWFGARAGSATGVEPYLTLTTAQLNQTGPANIRMEDTDNVQAWMPQAYTYGSVLSPGPDIAASTSGGSSISLFGYGLGNNAANLGGWAAGTTVTFGAAQGTISNAYSMPDLPTSTYPFPLWQLTVKTPAVSAGEAGITVSTASGTSTLASAYHSLNMPSYAMDESPLSLTYDATRNQLYIAVADHIDVFALSSNSFLAPIHVPTLNKVTQLGALALTPDGNSLLAANWGDGSVAIIDPDSPSTATAVAVGTVPGIPYGQGPNQLGATNTGLVFVGVGAQPYSISPEIASKIGAAHTKTGAVRNAQPQSYPAIEPEASVWVLNLGSMSAAAYTPMSGVLVAPFIAASPDGSEVCLTGEYLGYALYASSTAEVTYGDVYNEGSGCVISGSEAAASGGNGAGVSNFAAQEISKPDLLDYQLAALGIGAQPIGVAIDKTGALLYLPYSSGAIELFDIHTGELRETIWTPGALAQLADGPIAVDTTGAQIFVFTANGLTDVQMDVLPLAIGAISSSGSSWTIAGTGFSSGTVVSVDGAPLTTQISDAQHLQVSGAPNLETVHLVTLTNPDGHSYTYDAAYLR